MTIRLNDYEDAFFKAFSNLTGEQISTVLRNFAINHAKRILMEDDLIIGSMATFSKQPKVSNCQTEICYAKS